MSLLSALYSGVSGLQGQGMAIAAIGDNISNVNTIGFKGSRMMFQDMLSQSVLGGQLGRGTSVQAIEKQMSQGNLQPTGSVTDLALSGDGFFIARSPSGGQFYTRAGQFHLDNNGALVNPNGFVVQGFPTDQSGLAAGGLSDLRFPATQSPPKMTASVTINANLNASEQATPGAPTFTAFDPTSPTETSNFSSSQTVYDSLGQPHTVTTYFRKEADNRWSYHSMPAAGEQTAGSPAVAATGTLVFDTSGRLATHTATTNTFNFKGAAQGQQIAYDFGDASSGVSQFAQQSAVNSQKQDGFAAGVLANITIDQEGTVTGMFSNGSTRPLARIAVATFQANAGLEKAGGGMYRETSASGQALVGRANQGPRGQINSSSLELSNVDIANEFVNMITAQRAYQANSKTITTADSLLGEVINMRR